MERKLSCQAKRALAIIPTIGITKEDDENMDTCAGKKFSIKYTKLVKDTSKWANCSQKWHRFHDEGILYLIDVHSLQ